MSSQSKEHEIKGMRYRESSHALNKNISRSKNTILEFKQVNFSYEKSSPFIDGISFSINNGEFIGLLGANGSGKSTILKLAGGILKASGGSITLWNKSILLYKNRDRAKLLSYLPQVLDINIPFTAKELVSMGLYPYEIMPALTVDETLETAGLADKAESLITNLSGGERRRAFIAMTLLQGAGLLLLDEPLANLDIKYQIEFLKLLRILQKERDIAVFMALHDINVALQFEKIILVKEGKILCIGPPEEVLSTELIKDAFDVDVEILRQGSGGTYIHY